MNEELDLKQIFKFIYKRKNILICILLISILLGVIYTFIIKKPEYEVSTQILLDKADSSIEEFIKSNDILTNNKIETSFNKTNKIISIDYKSKNAEESFNEVNEYIEKLQEKLQEIYDIKVFNIIQIPKVPESACNINYLKDIIIITSIGLGIYIVYIIAVINFKNMLKFTDVENNLQLIVLGKVNLEKKKNKKETISYKTENEKIINQLKRIEANIEFNKENKKPKTILFTGTTDNVGTSYITNNLAYQYANIYEKVLVIDTNIFDKTLTKEYNLEKEIGLSNILVKNKNEKENIKTINNIFFIPVGNNETNEDVFLKEDIVKLIENLKNEYDIILIDTATINKKIIPIQLASIVDAITIVVDENKTNIEEIQRAKTTIENVGGKISGVVINKVD